MSKVLFQGFHSYPFNWYTAVGRRCISLVLLVFHRAPPFRDPCRARGTRPGCGWTFDAPLQCLRVHLFLPGSPLPHASRQGLRPLLGDGPPIRLLHANHLLRLAHCAGRRPAGGQQIRRCVLHPRFQEGWRQQLQGHWRGPGGDPLQALQVFLRTIPHEGRVTKAIPHGLPTVLYIGQEN